MKRKLILSVLLAGFVAPGTFPALAQRPVVSTSYTPDPAPYVHGDKVYMFTGHDEDDATYFKMNDWQVFSTEDMVNWTYLGTPVSTDTFAWCEKGDNAWASQALERGGKWYWYVCVIEEGTRANALAVAVADDPQGPWKDAIGGPLEGTAQIAPGKDWKTVTCNLKGTKGVHDIFFVFKGPKGHDLFEWDCWQIK